MIMLRTRENHCMENVEQVVPLLNVTSMERSLPFYRDGLGFALTNQWLVDDKVRWCWLTLGKASLMLQELRKPIADKLGHGVSICFQCLDALTLYHAFRQQNIHASEPQVGNNMWVTTVLDPDGYRLEFESATDVPEETLLSNLNK